MIALVPALVLQKHALEEMVDRTTTSRILDLRPTMAAAMPHPLQATKTALVAPMEAMPMEKR